MNHYHNHLLLIIVFLHIYGYINTFNFIALNADNICFPLKDSTTKELPRLSVTKHDSILPVPCLTRARQGLRRSERTMTSTRHWKSDEAKLLILKLWSRCSHPASINPSQPFHSDPSACHVSLPENSIKFKTVSINNCRIPRSTKSTKANVHHRIASTDTERPIPPRRTGTGQRQQFGQGHAMHGKAMMQHGYCSSNTNNSNNGHNGCGVDQSFRLRTSDTMANDLHMRYCVVKDGGRTGISNGTFNPVGFRLVFVGFIYKMAKTKHETLDRKLRILQSTIVYTVGHYLIARIK